MIVEQVLQRRSAKSTLFNDKTAGQCVYSFGDYDEDFWLGSAAVLAMTASKPYVLMFELTYRTGTKYFEYGGFSLYMEKTKYRTKYRIRLGVYLGGNLFGEYFVLGVYVYIVVIFKRALMALCLVFCVNDKLMFPVNM